MVSKKKAFTLVELLVVISIIALLLSILVPTLGKARKAAQRIVCESNINSQYTVQTTFAAANDGKFPNHDHDSPFYYYREDNKHDDQVYLALRSYVDDPMILICPLQKPLAKKYPVMGDPYWCGGLYNGWGAEKVLDSFSGRAPNMIHSGYMWTANFRTFTNSFFPGSLPEYNFQFPRTGEIVNETPWPTDITRCTSSAAFIMHPIWIWGSYIRDLAHGGMFADFISGTDYLKVGESIDNPVGYADGHIEIVKRSHIKPRVRTTTTNYYYLY